MINICVFPDEHVSRECVDISQSLKGDDVMFSLDGVNLFPHMTVFMARFPDEHIDDVVRSVETVLESIRSLRCTHTGYFMTTGRYLEASYRKSDEIMELHESIIRHVAEFRYNPGEPFQEDFFGVYTSEQQQNARDTGYDLARGLYRPHVTLTRYNEGAVPEVFPAFPAVNLSFNLGKVGVYKADENGAVYERIREFRVAS